MAHPAASIAPGEIRLRRYHPSDHAEVLQIAFETGFFGSSMSAVLDRPRRFVRAMDWYLANHNEHCFVAIRNGGIAGYTVASRQDVQLALAGLSIRHAVADLAQLPLMTPRERRYVLARVFAALRDAGREGRHFRTPPGSRLHINLRPGTRNRGVGSALLQALLADLRESGVRTVSTITYQGPRNNMSRFWKKNGFTEYSRMRSSAWQSWLGSEEILLVCYTRAL